MGDGFLFNLLDKLIGRLGSLAIKCWNVEDDIEKLRNTSSSIRSVLLDAEQLKATNHEVKDWLEKLKDALHDADDLLDDFSTEALRREVLTRDKKGKKVRIFFSKSNQVIFSLKMVAKMKEIREKLEAIDEDRKRFQFTNRVPERQLEKRRQTHSFIRKEDVIGRDEEKKRLVELLLDTTVKYNVSVIPIVGFGGLGKTALAQLAYNDEAVNSNFELKVWVCVSDEFDVKTIAEKITRSKTDNDAMDPLQEELRSKIEGKRYVFVLDDVWNENHEEWLKLMTLLKDGAKGSKILVTTRSEKVAKITGTYPPLFLKGLDENQSWELFTQLAFENGKEPENKQLGAIGKDIVRKCGGVPLAIRSIGSLMRFKDSEKDWVYFKDNDLVSIDEGNDTIFPILKLSYDHLPLHLKSCFAYCSLFPKDSEIDRKTLIQLWMAQGFCQSFGENRCMEEVANDYFNELVCRSFFQAFERDSSYSTDITSFKMHDLIHDLAVSVAGNDCAIGNEKGQHIHKQTRHLSFCRSSNSLAEVPTSLFKAKKLRTLRIFSSKEASGSILEESVCNLMISSFKHLRSFDSCYFDFKTLPTCIGMLKHLRYLNLAFNIKLKVLPQAIATLLNLQTLNLSFCSNLKELPCDLWKLVNLRHLDLVGCLSLTHMPNKLGQLNNLQTLSLFVIDASSRKSSGPKELGRLNNLRGQLEIKGLECLRQSSEDLKVLNLKEKQYLDYLSLDWRQQIDGDINEIAEDNKLLEGLQPHPNLKNLQIIGFGGVMISAWLSSFTNLIEIKIEWCVKLQNLPSMHLFTHLKILKLSMLPCMEWIENDSYDKHSISSGTSSTYLSSLEKLWLSYLPNLRGWWRSEEGLSTNSCHQQPLLFPSLKSLWICDCPNLMSIPLYSNVNKLHLTRASEKILRLGMLPTTTPVLSSSSLSKVTYLWLHGIGDLKSLFGVLSHLTAVHSLVISDCIELDLLHDEDGGDYSMQWKELRSLRILEIRDIPKMVSLPEGLQYVTTLQTLNIWHCSNLADLPEWIASLRSSLQYFSIHNCPKLKSLPEGVRYLTSLQRLTIIECPILEGRCQGEGSEDWPKISHVPQHLIPLHEC